MNTDELSPAVSPSTATTFRRAILHGLGIVMPPLLTILLFVWAWTTTENYVLSPLEAGIRNVLVWNLQEIEDVKPVDRNFVADPTGKKFLPQYVVSYVDQNLHRLGPFESVPGTAIAYWHRYVQLVYLPRTVVVPFFLLMFLVLLYFLGRMFANGIGRFFVRAMDRFIGRVPVVSNVYSSVKQVTDFVFSERDIEFNRVVAIEYPRKGIWSIGFVTGQSMADISAAANEPVLSVLMPTSPMPVTGFTVTVRKSEAVDLDLTIDQAIQFIVSCGVVVPAKQQQVVNRLQLELPGSDKAAAMLSSDGSSPDSSSLAD
ncbi:DUF502 domain-containing protein [Rosistilla ulvae]|nr:DUF502 domain-containing protein [Rosistilla ulvae]